MSQYTRLASTNSQEKAIRLVEKMVKATNKRIRGATTIGKSPQTVILDLTYQGSEIYINSNGTIEVNDNIVKSLADFKQAIK